MTDVSHQLVSIAKEIRNWIRAAAYPSVKQLLEDALPDDKSRRAYQMTDGKVGLHEIRKACNMSPNSVSALQNRCVALGLMSVEDNRKARLFDLRDFGLYDGVIEVEAASQGASNERQSK